MSYNLSYPKKKVPRKRDWKKKRPHRINEEVRVEKVRLIDEEKKYVGIIDSKEAFLIAKERGYDLVEVSPKANPPVCKLLDYGKFLYELQKKEHEAKKKQKKIQIKEIKFTPAIQDHDIQVKIKRIVKFLESGDKVKITIWLKGKQKRKPEMLGQMTDKIVALLKEISEIETMPKREGFRTQFLIKQMKGGIDDKTKNT
jgi:translation initiation factor IF-3